MAIRFEDSIKAPQNFVVTDTGNVGIGTLSPNRKLTVMGDVSANSFLATQNVTTGQIVSRLFNNFITTDGMYFNYNSLGGTSAHVRLYADGTNERMIVRADTGNVGIGTSFPNERLTVVGDISATGSIYGANANASNPRSVVNYGAIGNNSFDNTTAIQNAITSGTSAGELVEIYFPKGTYKVNGTVDFQNRIVSFNYEPGATLTGPGRIGNTFSPGVAYLPYNANKNWQFPRRITNRLFVGPSLSANPGLLWENDDDVFPDLPDLFPVDWLDTEIRGGATGIASLAALSEAGYIAVLGGSRTSDNPLGSSQGTMGIAGFVLANKQTENYMSSYALYAEAKRFGDPKGFCHGLESDVISKPPANDSENWQSLHPALQFTPQYPTGQSERGLINGWFSCSRPDADDGYTGDASVGVGLFNNAYPGVSTVNNPTFNHNWWRSGRYVTGILIDQKAIRGSVQVSGQPAGVYWHAGISNGQRPLYSQGNGGYGTAIAMGNHHVLTWFGNPDYPYANAHGITSTDTSTTAAAGGFLQDFRAGGVSFYQTWNTEILLITNAVYSRSVIPLADNTYTLGGTLNRWSTGYFATNPVVGSDERDKTEIQTSTLGLDFINDLRPVSYKFAIGGNKPIEKDPNLTLAEKLTSASVQEYETVPGQRTHWGLIAQEVKETVDNYSVDFAGWVLEDVNNANSKQALRYEQFIAPMIKAIQELSTEVQTLKAQLSATN